MNRQAAQLLEKHFDIAFAAPDGIKKLRELILTLAMQGKLVPQDAKDQPAAELLKEIEAEKLKSGLTRRREDAKKIKDDEVPYLVPVGWEWVALADIALINPRNVVENTTKVSFVPMSLIGTNINGSHLQESRIWSDVKSGFTHFSEGDIGLAKITPCFENSKACIFYNLTNGVGAGTTELHIIRLLGNTLVPRYVLAYLKSPQFLLIGQTKMTGTAGQKRLPKFYVESNPFPLPPLAEQHRIVAKIDELMARCDELEKLRKQREQKRRTVHTAAIRQLLADSVLSFASPRLRVSDFLFNHFSELYSVKENVAELRKAILQLAVMGKLVQQDPSDQPAAELLKEIEAEKQKSGLTRRREDAKKVKPEEVPYQVPAGWEWVRLGDIVQIKGGKRVSNGYKLLTVPTSYVYIRVSDMKNGSIDDSDLHYIDENMYLKISNYIISSDDLYMTIVGATIGKCGCVPEKFSGMNLTENAARIMPYKQVDKLYLLKCLESSYCQQQFIDKTKQVGVQKMALNRLSDTVIPFPPLTEQRRIVAKIDQLMALCDEMDKQIEASNQKQTALLNAVMSQVSG